MRRQLEAVAAALSASGDTRHVDQIRRSLAGDDDNLNEFLVSDTLWGGSGSIADQGGIVADPRPPERRAVESALVALGEAQMAAGIVNVRTAMWVDAFRGWAAAGI